VLHPADDEHHQPGQHQRDHRVGPGPVVRPAPQGGEQVREDRGGLPPGYQRAGRVPSRPRHAAGRGVRQKGAHRVPHRRLPRSQCAGHGQPAVSELQAFWKWATEEGQVAENPMRRMRPPSIPEKAVPVLSDDQIWQLLAGCDSKGSRADGMRRSSGCSSTPAFGSRRWWACRSPPWTWTGRSPASRGRPSVRASSGFGDRTARAIDRPRAWRECDRDFVRSLIRLAGPPAIYGRKGLLRNAYCRPAAGWIRLAHERYAAGQFGLGDIRRLALSLGQIMLWSGLGAARLRRLRLPDLPACTSQARGRAFARPHPLPTLQI
jgi:hypothetical protein